MRISDWSSDVCSSDLVVLGIDTDKERISLGIKQLEGDPFNNFVATYDKGAVVPGVIKSVEARGAVVTLSVDVEGYLRASEISTGRVEDASRSEERRVGKEWVGTCRFRWSPNK